MEDDSQEKQTPPYRGLYGKLNIPVKVLDGVIIACVVVILLVVVLELRNPGFTVTFDSKGGTDVPAQTQMYDEYLDEPEPPTREGYTFTGWYKDEACQEKWFLQIDTVRDDMTLYAGWQKNE